MNTPKPKRGRPPKEKQVPPVPPNQLMVAWKTFLLRIHLFAVWARRHGRKYKTAVRGLESFLVVFPPYFVGQYYQVEKFATQMRTDWPLLAALLDHHVAVSVSVAGVWAFFVLATFRLLSRLAVEAPNGWSSAPSLLLTALDNVVGAKEQRFSKHLKNVRGPQPPKMGEVFSFITQPSQQLNELIQGIYSVISTLLREQGTEKHVLKVNLAAVGSDGDIKAIHFHFPSNHPVRSDVADLNNPQSAMKWAIRTKRAVVIESICVESVKPKPKARFVVTDLARAEEDGSLICYPVVHDALGAVVFVISIHVDCPGVFKQKFLSSYNELLKPFALRIKLEYSLLALKEIAV